jgi:Protein of unknown function (DUF4240)
MLNEEMELNKIELIKESVEKLEPLKPENTTDNRKIDEPLFWNLIETSRKETENKIEFLDLLKNKLEAFKPNEIKNFDRLLRIKANELNTQRNWRWLILLGKVAAMTNLTIQSLGCIDGIKCF